MIWLNNSKPGLYNGVPYHNWKSSQGIVRCGTELWIYLVVSNQEMFKNSKSLDPACPRSLNQNHWGWSPGTCSVYKLDLHYLYNNSLPRKEGKENNRVIENPLCFDVSIWNRVENCLLPFIALCSTSPSVGLPASIKCYCHFMNFSEIVQTMKITLLKFIFSNSIFFP